MFFSVRCKILPPKFFLKPKMLLAKFTGGRLSGSFRTAVAAKKVFFVWNRPCGFFQQGRQARSATSRKKEAGTPSTA
jgi:hypothetical protein